MNIFWLGERLMWRQYYLYVYRQMLRDRDLIVDPVPVDEAKCE